MGNRVSNFYSDNIIGKVGEDDFKKNVGNILVSYYGSEILNNREWKYNDVSNDWICRLRDIDFILFDSYSNISDFSQLTEEQRANIVMHNYNGIIKVEVKTDTVTNTSRNIVYELISHYSGGCWAVTSANLVYYVCVDSEDTNKIVGRYVVDVLKLRDFIIRNHTTMSHQNYDIKNPSIPLVMNSVTKQKRNGEPDDPILNILVNLDTLIQYNIAKEIKL